MQDMEFRNVVFNAARDGKLRRLKVLFYSYKSCTCQKPLQSQNNPAARSKDQHNYVAISNSNQNIRPFFDDLFHENYVPIMQ